MVTKRNELTQSHPCLWLTGIASLAKAVNPLKSKKAVTFSILSIASLKVSVLADGCHHPLPRPLWMNSFTNTVCTVHIM